MLWYFFHCSFVYQNNIGLIHVATAAKNHSYCFNLVFNTRTHTHFHSRRSHFSATNKTPIAFTIACVMWSTIKILHIVRKVMEKHANRYIHANISRYKQNNKPINDIPCSVFGWTFVFGWFSFSAAVVALLLPLLYITCKIL